MKAKESNSLTRNAKQGVAVGAKKSTTTVATKGATKPKTVAHAKNGAAALPSISSPVNGKAVKQEILKAERFSAKELARFKKLKAYFDMLDEDTHIRELEKLSLEEMHYLACSYLAEDIAKGRRLT